MVWQSAFNSFAYKIKVMKRKEFPPLSPLAEKIKKILDHKLEAPRYDIVTGKTVAAVAIEKLMKKQINEIISWIEMGEGGWSSNDIIDNLESYL